MKCFLVCVLAAATLGVVLSLPFKRYGTTKHNVLKTIHDIGATKFDHFIHKSGLQGNYSKKAGNFTLFVPDNAAFKNLCRSIKHNMTLMRQVLLFHSVNGTYDSFDLTQGKNLTTLSGRQLFINVTETGAILVNGVNVTKRDIWARNGIIFLVNEVILTGSGVNCTHGNHTHHNMTLHPCHNGTAVNCTHHGNHTHHNMTLHRCHNGTFGVNCSHHGNHTHHNMTTNLCHNGTSGLNCSHHGNHSHGNVTRGTIHHYLTQHYQKFSNLIYNLMKTGVWADLEGEHVTLLAPTNHAFDAMGKMQTANMNDMQFLKATMQFHVLKGTQPPSGLHQGQFLTSLDGHRMHVGMTNGHVSHFNMVEIANVIHATNGIIYIMKGVLHAPQQAHPI